MMHKKKIIKREYNGQFAFDGNFDRLCVCGHTLGVHSAGSPAGCLLYSLSDAEKSQEVTLRKQLNPDVNCGCVRFRLSRKKEEPK